MLSKCRNEMTFQEWSLTPVTDFCALSPFDCDEPDLNDYFQNDCQAQQAELLNVTYALTPCGGPFFPTALISLSNDAIRREKLEDGLRPTVSYPSYPAVKIGRLGVHKEFQRDGIGTHLVNMVKTLFVTNNRTGCRFVTVDAYNQENVLNFYQKNGFDFLTDKDISKPTRAMFFDLIRVIIPGIK